MESDQPVERVFILAGDDLHDLLERMLLVAGIDALGAVAELEIHAASEA
jgi:hypothetical protein